MFGRANPYATLYPRGLDVAATASLSAGDAERDMDLERNALRDNNMPALMGIYQNPLHYPDGAPQGAAAVTYANPDVIMYHPDYVGDPAVQSHELGHVGTNARDMRTGNMLRRIASDAWGWNPDARENVDHRMRYWGPQDNLEHMMIYTQEAAQGGQWGRDALTRLSNLMGREVTAEQAREANRRMTSLMRDYGYNREDIQRRREESISQRGRAEFSHRATRRGRAVGD